MANHIDPVAKVKEWITPSLVTVLGVVLWNQLTELKSDVKTLLINQSAYQVRISSLEKDMDLLKKASFYEHSHQQTSQSDRSSFGDRGIVAKKEEETRVPNPEQAYNEHL
jgi:hypothetical protein